MYILSVHYNGEYNVDLYLLRIAIKQSTVCNDAIDVAFEITKLIQYSPKQNTF